MKHIAKTLTLAAFCLPISAIADDGYRITGNSGVMVFVSIDIAQEGNEDVYRIAAGEACSGRAICQVQYWVGEAPSGLPLTDAEVDSKLVQWQQNLSTGLRRWLVKCSDSDLFVNERGCM